MFLIFLLPLAPGQFTAHATSQTVLGVWSTTYSSNNITDPGLVPGSTFTIGVNVTNIPPILNQTTGGINAFDIILRYDPTVLNATDAAVNAPMCPASEGCLFDRPEAFTIQKELNSTGSVRLASVLLNKTVDGSGILFKTTFKVVHAGSTTLHIREDSQLVGPVPNQPQPIAPVPYQPQDGEFSSPQPNIPPVVQFVFTPANPNATGQVSFDGSQSYDSDGSIVSYRWDLGDGTSSQGSQVVHSFANPGNYSVTLTVTDNEGAMGVRTEVVRVSSPAPSGSNNGTGNSPPSTPLIPALAVGGAALIGILAVLAYVRRKKQK